MSDIAPIGRPQAASLARNGQSAPSAAADAEPARAGGDKVEVSSIARYLNLLASLPDVRQELVDRVRGEIEAGTYETPDKIETTVDELAEDLA